MKTKALILSLFILAGAVVAIGADPATLPIPAMFKAPVSPATSGSLPDAVLEIAALRAEVARQEQIVADLTEEVATLREQAKADGKKLPIRRPRVYPPTVTTPFRTQSGYLEQPLVHGMVGRLPCPVRITTVSGDAFGAQTDPLAPLPDTKLGILGVNTSGFGMTRGNYLLFEGEFRVISRSHGYKSGEYVRPEPDAFGLQSEGTITVTVVK